MYLFNDSTCNLIKRARSTDITSKPFTAIPDMNYLPSSFSGLAEFEDGMDLKSL